MYTALAEATVGLCIVYPSSTGYGGEKKGVDQPLPY